MQRAGHRLGFDIDEAIAAGTELDRTTITKHAPTITSAMLVAPIYEEDEEGEEEEEVATGETLDALDLVEHYEDNSKNIGVQILRPQQTGASPSTGDPPLSDGTSMPVPMTEEPIPSNTFPEITGIAFDWDDLDRAELSAQNRAESQEPGTVPVARVGDPTPTRADSGDPLQASDGGEAAGSELASINASWDLSHLGVPREPGVPTAPADLPPGGPPWQTRVSEDDLPPGPTDADPNFFVASFTTHQEDDGDSDDSEL